MMFNSIYFILFLRNIKIILVLHLVSSICHYQLFMHQKEKDEHMTEDSYFLVSSRSD